MRPISSALLFYLVYSVQVLSVVLSIYFSNRNVLKKNAKVYFSVSVACSAILLLLAVRLFPHRNIKARLSKRGGLLSSSLFRRGVPVLVVLMVLSSAWLSSLHYRNWKQSNNVNYFDSSNNEGVACLVVSFALFLIPIAPFIPHVVYVR